jgi:hypothetical protein
MPSLSWYSVQATSQVRLAGEVQCLSLVFAIEPLRGHLFGDRSQTKQYKFNTLTSEDRITLPL